MKYEFEYLKAIALDPFARQVALQTTLPRPEQRGSVFSALHDDAACLIANGAWSQAECCCDPGPDEFPEVKVPLPTHGSH